MDKLSLFDNIIDRPSNSISIKAHLEEINNYFSSHKSNEKDLIKRFSSLFSSWMYNKSFDSNPNLLDLLDHSYNHGYLRYLILRKCDLLALCSILIKRATEKSSIYSFISKYTVDFCYIFESIPPGSREIFTESLEKLLLGISKENMITIICNLCKSPLIIRAYASFPEFIKLRKCLVDILNDENSDTSLIINALAIKFHIWPNCTQFFSEISAHKTLQLLFNGLINDDDELLASCAADLIWDLSQDSQIMASFIKYPKILDCIRETIHLLQMNLISLLPKIVRVVQTFFINGSDEIRALIIDQISLVMFKPLLVLPQPPISKGRGKNARKTRTAQSLAPSSQKSAILLLISTIGKHYEISTLVHFLSTLIPSILELDVRLEQIESLIHLAGELLNSCCNDQFCGTEHLIKCQVIIKFVLVVVQGVFNISIKTTERKKLIATGAALTALLPSLDTLLHQESAKNNLLNMMSQCISQIDGNFANKNFEKSLISGQINLSYYDDISVCKISCVICADLAYVMYLCTNFWYSLQLDRQNLNISHGFNFSMLAPSFMLASAIKRKPEKFHDMEVDLEEPSSKTTDDIVTQQTTICEQALTTFLTQPQMCVLLSLLFTSLPQKSCIAEQPSESLTKYLLLLKAALNIPEFNVNYFCKCLESFSIGKWTDICNDNNEFLSSLLCRMSLADEKPSNVPHRDEFAAQWINLILPTSKSTKSSNNVKKMSFDPKILSRMDDFLSNWMTNTNKFCNSDNFSEHRVLFDVFEAKIIQLQEREKALVIQCDSFRKNEQELLEQHKSCQKIVYDLEAEQVIWRNLQIAALEKMNSLQGCLKNSEAAKKMLEQDLSKIANENIHLNELVNSFKNEIRTAKESLKAKESTIIEFQRKLHEAELLQKEQAELVSKFQNAATNAAKMFSSLTTCSKGKENL